MSSKGPSNLYGNSRGGKKGFRTIKIAYAWAKDFIKTTLKHHLEEHGKNMKADTFQTYIAKAIKFANNIDKKNCISFIDKNHTTYKYNVKTNELVLVTEDGYVITYFKPEKGINYYYQQKNKKESKKL